MSAFTDGLKSFFGKSVVFGEAHPEWVIRVAFLIAGVVLGHFWWR